MRCKHCNKKISFRELLNSSHEEVSWFEFFLGKGQCDSCEKKYTMQWVKKQMKLIKEGKRGIPIC